MNNNMTISEAWAEEEQLKDAVYTHLTKEIGDDQSKVLRAERYVQTGAFEDQEAFTAHGALSDLRKRAQKKSREYASVFEKPYFAHMDVHSGGGSLFQFLLSDSAELESMLQVGHNRFIMPFKRSAEAPMLTALFEQYAEKKSNNFSVNAPGGINTYCAKLLRDVDISDGI